MEQELRLPIDGSDLSIYGTLEDNDGPLVIFCHGLTCSRNEPVILNGAHLLHDRGFATFRFDFYNGNLDSRSFLENTIEDNATDIDTVIAHFRMQHPQRTIAVVEHSLGGMAALASPKKDYDALVLLDASHGSIWDGERSDAFEGRAHDRRTRWDELLHLYRLGDDLQVLASPKLIASRMRDSDADARGVQNPTLIVVAKDGLLKQAGQRYLENIASSAKELREVDSDHSFYSKRPMPQMFSGIADWLYSQLG